MLLSGSGSMPLLRSRLKHPKSFSPLASSGLTSSSINVANSAPATQESSSRTPFSNQKRRKGPQDTISEDQSSSNKTDANRIYFLGLGNIALLIAHSLAKLPTTPPMTLLFHRQGLLDLWQEVDSNVELVTNGLADRRQGFDVEVLPSPLTTQSSSQMPEIRNLIVATKAAHVATALSTVKHRLSPESAILFTQNGMGVAEEASAKVFPDENSRPIYMSATISHGVFTNSRPFSCTHAGQGTTTVGVIPPNMEAARLDESYGKLDSSSNLVSALMSATALATSYVNPLDLIQTQLSKLVTNSIINPLTAIFHCRNGEIVTDPAIKPLVRLLLSEIAAVIRSLPVSRSIPHSEAIFSAEKLEEVVFDVGRRTAENTSSMLQDVKAQRATEIEYMNGYIVRKGTEMGILCPTNERLLEMVRASCQIHATQIRDCFGFK